MSNTSLVPMCHPSVRIAGTENDYVPVLCTDRHCTSATVSHMHCPFCVKVETYHDARILRAHYRVKHVDKGIQFAGLKILRCCEQCDIVGAIKGEKKFKGAHWHCYRCKNGFNRRDEAKKHYKTHFRHPYTTFQIHIFQEVNSAFDFTDRKEEDLENRTSFSNTSAVTSVILQNDEHISCQEEQDCSAINMEEGENDHRINDIAQPSEGQTAVMISQGDHMEGAATNISSVTKEQEETTYKRETGGSTSVLEAKIQTLREEKENLEAALNAEIEQLKDVISKQEQEIDSLRKREEALAKELSSPSDNQMQQLIASLQDQHAQLLQEHLLQLRKEVFAASSNVQNRGVNVTSKSSVPATNQQVVGIVLQESSAAGIIRQTFPTSYTICVSNSGPKNELQQNYLIAPEPDKTVKSIVNVANSGNSNPKVLFISQGSYKSNQDENATFECAENYVMSGATCGNLVVAQPNVNDANGGITFLTEEQLQNCLGATVFNQNSTGPYLVINQKADSQIIPGKRKLYIEEYPPEKKHAKEM